MRGQGWGAGPILLPSSARLTRVTVWHRDYLDGIQLETDFGMLPRIGGTGKHRDVQSATFELAADEFLSGISVEFWQCVDRLTFHTNSHNYGPYGRAALAEKDYHAA